MLNVESPSLGLISRDFLLIKGENKARPFELSKVLPPILVKLPEFKNGTLFPEISLTILPTLEEAEFSRWLI